MIVQAQEQEGKGSVMPTIPLHTPTINPPSTSKPQKKQSIRKQRKYTEVSQPSDPIEPMVDETENMESIPTHSNDPLLSGEDRLKLNELMELCTSLSQRVLDMEKTKTSQAVGRSARVVSSEDKGLGDQEDASKQGRKIVDLDVDTEEVKVEKEVSTADPITTAGEVVTTANVEVTTDSATTTTVDELTLAQ
ncbi:hypothetical protein Tco_0903960, partial [Tanacetum coccineum]